MSLPQTVLGHPKHSKFLQIAACAKISAGSILIKLSARYMVMRGGIAEDYETLMSDRRSSLRRQGW